MPKELSGTLYLTGYSDEICGYPEASVFRYDGSAFHEWEPFQQIPFDAGNYVGYVFDFQGYTYMSGVYRNPLGPGDVGLMRFNGSAWENVPGWNTTLAIKDYTIRNDTLYVAGAFRTSSGGPGNYVAYFDGQNWNDMAGGMSLPVAPNSAAVTTLRWHGDRLYAGGVFTHASGQSMNGGLAWWDGEQWCGFPEIFEHEPGDQDPLTRPTVLDIAVWRDSLFITGSYRNTANETIKQVAQWIGGNASINCEVPDAIIDQPWSSSLEVFPNPAQTELSIRNSPSGASHIQVRDALGRLLLDQPYTAGRSISVEHLSAGTYAVRLLNNRSEHLATGRFIRQ
ncbi:MAG: T9SS type A sorting domain-containing protein [Flavobacteriales bacterium]|nr:T9SS type A sorting domain-containing protein [Flavobacteriales bacterium]